MCVFVALGKGLILAKMVAIALLGMFSAVGAVFLPGSMPKDYLNGDLVSEKQRVRPCECMFF